MVGKCVAVYFWNRSCFSLVVLAVTRSCFALFRDVYKYHSFDTINCWGWIASDIAIVGFVSVWSPFGILRDGNWKIELFLDQEKIGKKRMRLEFDQRIWNEYTIKWQFFLLNGKPKILKHACIIWWEICNWIIEYKNLTAR